jgi:uncharacterized membrane protein YqhA
MDKFKTVILWCAVVTFFVAVMLGFLVSLGILAYTVLYFVYSIHYYSFEFEDFCLLIEHALHLIDLLFLMAIPTVLGFTIYRNVLLEIQWPKPIEALRKRLRIANKSKMRFLDSWLVCSLVSIVAVFLLENLIKSSDLSSTKLWGSIFLILSLSFYLWALKRAE